MRKKLEEFKVIILTKEDQKVFVETLLNPPKLNQKVKNAAQRYKQMMGI
jgi:uncharacterized protein (DUF1778 family)